MIIECGTRMPQQNHLFRRLIVPYWTINYRYKLLSMLDQIVILAYWQNIKIGYSCVCLDRNNNVLENVQCFRSRRTWPFQTCNSWQPLWCSVAETINKLYIKPKLLPCFQNVLSWRSLCTELTILDIKVRGTRVVILYIILLFASSPLSMTL